MTKRELQRNMKSAFRVPPPQHKQEFLACVSACGENGEGRKKVSRREFCRMQFRYIRKRVWVLSALLLLAVWRMVHLAGTLPENFKMAGRYGMLWFASVVVPLLAVIAIVELNRSLFCGMGELELSTKYNLTEIFFARMIYLGIGNFIWLVMLSLILQRESGEWIFMLTIYLLVPYLVTTVLTLELLCRCHRENAVFCCVASGVFVSVSYLLLLGNVKENVLFDAVYQPIWIGVCLILLCAAARKLADMKNEWEGQLCG